MAPKKARPTIDTKLRLLATKFLSKLPEVGYANLAAAARDSRIQKRRIIDIINVLAAVGIARKTPNGRIEWMITETAAAFKLEQEKKKKEAIILKDVDSLQNQLQNMTMDDEEEQ